MLQGQEGGDGRWEFGVGTIIKNIQNPIFNNQTISKRENIQWK